MTKYGAKKVTLDGIIFDSKAEGDYYLLLKRQKELGKIKDFDLQPRFELVPKFERNGIKFQDIEYVADFRIYNNDGTTSIIDVKGMITKDFALKYKMYMYKYYEKEPLILLSYSKIDGGWIEHKELKKNRRVRSKDKKVEKERKAEEQRLRELNYMIDVHLEYVNSILNLYIDVSEKFKKNIIKFVKENYHTIDDLVNCNIDNVPKLYKKTINLLIIKIKEMKN